MFWYILSGLEMFLAVFYAISGEWDKAQLPFTKSLVFYCLARIEKLEKRLE